MATVKYEDKEINIPDKVVEKGDAAIRKVLAASGYPASENAHIQIIRDEKDPQAPAIVNVAPRPTHKGTADDQALVIVEGEEPERHPYQDFFDALDAAPEAINPAVSLAQRVVLADQEGTGEEFMRRLMRSGELDRTIHDGMRFAREAMNAHGTMIHTLPKWSKVVPVGF